MLAWYFARQSVLPRAMAGAVALVVVSVAFNELVDREFPATQVLARLGVFAVAFALPYAAISLRYMDLDGRLDQVRLGDRPPLVLAAAAVVGLGVPWLVAAAAAVVASGSTVVREPGFLRDAGALVAVAWAFGAWGLALASRRGAASDPRILAAGTALMVTVGAALVGQTPGLMLEFLGTPAERGTIVVWTLGVALVALGAGALLAVRRVSRPLRSTPAKPSSPPAPLARLMRRIGPIAGRGVLLTYRPAFALALVAIALPGVVIAVRNLPWNAAWLYAYVVLAAIVVSFTARLDADGRGLEMFTLADGGGAQGVAAFVLGLWLPFAVCGVAVAAGASLVFGYPPGLLTVVALALAVMPLTVAEGWHGLFPLAYAGIILLLGVIPIVRYAPGEELALWDWGGIAALVMAALALGGRVAQRAVARPGDVVLRGWSGSAAAAMFAPLAAFDRDLIDLVSLGLIVISGWYSSPGARLTGLERWRPPLTVGLAVVVASMLGSSRFAPGWWVTTAAALPMAALWAAARIHERFGTRSIVGRVAIALAVLQTTTVAGQLRPIPWVQAALTGPLPGLVLNAIAGLVIAVTIVAVVEALVRLAPRRRQGTA